MRSKWVSVVIVGSVVLVGAAALAATVIEKAHFKGKFAFAVCSMSEPITCSDGSSGQLNTDIFVDGAEFASRSLQSPDEGRNLVSATVRQFNSCTDEFDAAFGNAEGGFKARGLQSADIQASIPLRDFDTEEFFGTLDVDLDVNGFGDTQTQGDHIRFDFEDEGGHVFIVIKFTDRSRSATASGTVRLNGTDVPCTFQEAGIVDTKSGFRETLR